MLINDKNIKSPIVEAYKTLRTNIQFSAPDGGPKIIMVTSTGPAEGKSTTCINLAISISQTNKKVLLIDGDLRKSVMHMVLNISNIKGLTNILSENASISDVVKYNVMDNLDVITGGPNPPNPSELLNSKRMKTFLELARNSYDVIIVDTPPVLAVTDAVIIAPMVDGVLLVIAHGQATFKAAASAKDLLERTGAKILGVLLNCIPVSREEGYYYYYYEEDYSSISNAEIKDYKKQRVRYG